MVFHVPVFDTRSAKKVVACQTLYDVSVDFFSYWDRKLDVNNNSRSAVPSSRLHYPLLRKDPLEAKGG